jgi:hypothetical protein
MGPDRPRRARRSRPASTRPPTSRPAAKLPRGTPPRREPHSIEADASRELQRLHARRLRACRTLGIPIPEEARAGPPATLLRRIALLDRRIEVSLDLAGGRQFPPWEEEDAGDEPPDEAETGGTFS